MEKVVLASGNRGKLKEINAFMHDFDWQCVAQSELGIESATEDGLSFVENAIKKARHAAKHANLPALADDSGLVVPAIKGAPGIYSARYAGDDASDEQNIQHLLTSMSQLEPSQRMAYFYCCIVYMRHAEDPTPIICQGQVYGHILQQPQGHSGFGYDPVFYLNHKQCTMAQLPIEVKNTLSHRAHALKQLREMLEQSHV